MATKTGMPGIIGTIINGPPTRPEEPTVPEVPAVTAKKAPYVTDKSLASTQLNNILNENSPLMKSAATAANQAANAKGLLNTSGAVQAGQKAVIDSATPIALDNAQAYQASNQLRQQGDINTKLEKLNQQGAINLERLGQSGERFMEQLRQQGNIDLQNLNNTFTQSLETMRYNRQDAQLLAGMVNAQTVALMNNIGNLLQNTDIEMSDNVTKWMSDFMNSSWQSAAELFNIPIEVK